MWIKILNINLIWWRTGTYNLIKTIWNGLGKGFEIHNLVWYWFWDNVNADSIYKANNSLLYWNFRYKLAVWLNFLFDRMTPWCINMNYLNNYKPYKEANIIHLHSIQWGFFNRNILPEISKQKKIVMTCHDDRIVSGNDKRNLFPYKTKKQYIERKKIFSNTKINFVWVSNWISNKLKNDWIIWDNPITTIYNWINSDIFYKKDRDLCRQELWLPLNKKIIVSIAWAGQKSNLKWIQYVEKIRENNSNLKNFLFISIWNNKDKKASDNLWEIWFITPDMMSKYFSAADLFLYPTLADNCPLAVIESLACWLPILTFSTWWVPEIVQHKENGYIAKYKDYDDLEKWFHWICNNLGILNKKLKNDFFQENMIKKYGNLYSNLVDN